jgi:hypothetical protein
MRTTYLSAAEEAAGARRAAAARGAVEADGEPTLESQIADIEVRASRGAERARRSAAPRSVAPRSGAWPAAQPARPPHLNELNGGGGWAAD